MKTSRPSLRSYLATAKAVSNPVLERRAEQARKSAENRKVSKAVRP